MTSKGIRRALVPYLLLVLFGVILGLLIRFLVLDVARDSPIRLAHPWALTLLSGSVLVAWVRLHLRKARVPTLAFSRVGDLPRVRTGWVAWLIDLPDVLRILAVALIALALTRPQTSRDEIVDVESIDIMIALDLSRSMEERDMRYNRLDAGQRTIREFVHEVPDDRIGLVVFAQGAMLQCPLTLDHRALDQIVASQKIGDVPYRGTAIGDALALSLATLRRSPSNSRVAILLSDGESNWTTEFTPQEAKELAIRMRVKVFTILLGNDEQNAGWQRGRHPVNPDLLREIARDTGGAFFHATDNQGLIDSFQAVRKSLELTRHRVRRQVWDGDLYSYALIPGLLLLGLEWLLRMTRWRRFP